MKDINFFLPYLEARKFKFNSKFFLNVILILCVFSLLSYGVFNHLKIKKLTENMEKFRAVAEDPETLEKVKIISSEEEELNRFKIEVESIRNLKDSVDETDFINAEYIDEIASKKPKDLFFNSINVTTESINISGTSDNRLSIAEFGQGVKTIENIEDIFISSIVRDETIYNFDLEVDLIREVEDGTIEESQENKEPEEEKK